MKNLLLCKLVILDMSYVLSAFMIFFFASNLSWCLIKVCQCNFVHLYPVWISWILSVLTSDIFFLKTRRFSALIFWNFFFFSPSLFFLSFWDFNEHNIGYFIILPKFLRLCLLFLSIHFPLYCSTWVNSIYLFSSLLTLSFISPFYWKTC